MTDPAKELLPCRACEAPGVVETFSGEHIEAVVWMCSKARVRGGDCPNPLAYWSAEDWNTRAQPDRERIAHILSEMGGAADWSHALAIADAIVGDAGG